MQSAQACDRQRSACEQNLRLQSVKRMVCCDGGYAACRTAHSTDIRRLLMHVLVRMGAEVLQNLFAEIQLVA